SFIVLVVIFNHDAAPAIYTLSLHDALPIYPYVEDVARRLAVANFIALAPDSLTSLGGYPGDDEKALAMFGQLDRGKMTEDFERGDRKSTTSELQSHLNLVCRLLLEKKKKKKKNDLKNSQASFHTTAYSNWISDSPAEHLVSKHCALCRVAFLAFRCSRRRWSTYQS